jgi:signal transduction histidine kinase
MTVIQVTRRQSASPGRTARAVLFGVLALLALACAVVLTSAALTSPPASAIDAFRLGCDLLQLAAGFITAAFLIRGPQLSWFQGYLAVALVAYIIGATRIDDLAASMLPGIPWFGPAFTVASCFAFLPIAYLFPNGRFAPRWSRWLLLGWVAAAALALAFAWDEYPAIALAALSVLVIGLIGTLVGAQIYRYARISSRLERQQTKWLLLALGVQAVWLVIIVALPPNTIGNLPGAEGAILDTVIAAFGALVTTALAVAIGFAMLRYRLFDVDLVIGRTLVYGAITVFILLSYAVVVGSVGLLWSTGTPLVLPVAATLVAALGIEPVRRMLQRRVNRWLYGQRDEPAAVLSRLADELSATSDLDGTLNRIATTVANALRFPRVSVSALDGEGQVGEFVAGATLRASDSVVVGIVFEGRTVGALEATPRPGERITPRDRAMLERLAQPAGVAIQGALITEQLRRSKGAIIEAQELERRRLHRDLHDGLGPTLSSLHQRIDLAERAIAADPARARALLDGARTGLAGALEELHTLVDSLRPAALDQLGLVGAITESWTTDERVVVSAPDALSTLPAVTESAAYRIAMEAVSNAVRHSGAERCSVTVTEEHGFLTIHVTDNGRGLPSTTAPGGGMRTMRERATELGGTFELADAAPGTRITARLPLAAVAP